MIWALAISLSISVIVNVILFRSKSLAKGANVAAVVGALVVGAGGGSAVAQREGFNIDEGRDTKTVFIAARDSIGLRPENEVVINRPIRLGGKFVIGAWNDTTLVFDYAYTKTTECDSGKFTRAIVSIIIDDVLE